MSKFLRNIFITLISSVGVGFIYLYVNELSLENIKINYQLILVINVIIASLLTYQGTKSTEIRKKEKRQAWSFFKWIFIYPLLLGIAWTVITEDNLRYYYPFLFEDQTISNIS